MSERNGGERGRSDALGHFKGKSRRSLSSVQCLGRRDPSEISAVP